MIIYNSYDSINFEIDDKVSYLIVIQILKRAETKTEIHTCY